MRLMGFQFREGNAHLGDQRGNENVLLADKLVGIALAAGPAAFADAAWALAGRLS